MSHHNHNHHVANQINFPELRSDSTLYVVVPVSNPVRYHSRYRLARKTIRELAATKNVKLIVVEAAYGDRHHELKELCAEVGADLVPLRIKTEIWIKENMINLGMRHAIHKYQANYLAWVDADVQFHNPGWALETVQQLQHFPILQPWQSAVNLGPTGGISKAFDSVGEKLRKGMPAMTPVSRKGEPGKRYSGDPYVFGHTGYAWACTRTFWEHVGGLIEFAILGSADHHMALGCRGHYSHSVHSLMKGIFADMIHAWQKKAMQLTHGRIGCVDGFVSHSHHGPMERRNYVGRWEILIVNKFDPVAHLHKDGQGVIFLVGNPHLEHAIQSYNRSRLEDSNEEY